MRVTCHGQAIHASTVLDESSHLSDSCLRSHVMLRSEPILVTILILLTHPLYLLLRDFLDCHDVLGLLLEDKLVDFLLQVILDVLLHLSSYSQIGWYF